MRLRNDMWTVNRFLHVIKQIILLKHINLTFKNDKYKKTRGGRSRWLLLHCEKCKNLIALYQKDGPGILKRLYVDRILTPEKLTDKKNKKLVCNKCGTLLGVQDVYEKEDRLVYRLFAGAVGKKIMKKNGV